MKLQKLLGYTRRAIDDYQMIREGDVIAIGMSGGKDSLTLLYALAYLRNFYPKKFDIIAITIDLGFEGMRFDEIKSLCDSLQVKYYIEHTQIAEIVFEHRKESNPCSLCARMRKGALNDRIKELGCNKIAYAHHKDDVIETFLMSLLYEGRIHCFQPVTHLERVNLTVIRPLIYAYEGEIISFSNTNNLPVAKNNCPVDGHTKRESTKNLVTSLKKDTPEIKERIFSALQGSNLPGWNLHNN